MPHNPGQQERAIEAYKKAIALNPTLIPAYNNLGTLLEQLERYEKAIQVYKQALDVTPTSALLHRNIGVVYQKMQNMPAALEAYRDYMRLTKNPDPDIKTMIEHYDQQHQAASSSPDYLHLATQGSRGRRLIWPSDQMPIPVQIDIDPDQTPFLKSVEEALKAWRFATDDRITFKHVGKLHHNIGILIRFKDGPLTHPSQEVGHAKYSLVTPTNGGGISSALGKSRLHVDVTLNTGEREAPIPLDYRVAHVKRLAMHELGHGLGLWGHSSDPADIMFSRPMSSHLSARDIRTIRSLYRMDTNTAANSLQKPPTNAAINSAWVSVKEPKQKKHSSNPKKKKSGWWPF